MTYEETARELLEEGNLSADEFAQVERILRRQTVEKLIPTRAERELLCTLYERIGEVVRCAHLRDGELCAWKERSEFHRRRGDGSCSELGNPQLCEYFERAGGEDDEWD